MLAWTDVMLAYTTGMALCAWAVPRFQRARVAAAAALVSSWLVWWLWPNLTTGNDTRALLTWVVVPAAALLGTYRLSGAFIVRPSERLERGLLALDDRLLRRTGLLDVYRAAPAIVPEIVETLYLLVYLVVPAGAFILLFGGHDSALPAYWTTVFAAELTCYAGLPWLQSRPPRMLEPREAPGAAVRALNQWVVRHGSIQLNTFPSAHAAGAVAVGLSVRAAMPETGLVFLCLGAGITLATVLGRYHYALDAMLGALVAVAARVLVMRS
jgi:hypothetical protein